MSAQEGSDPAETTQVDALSMDSPNSSSVPTSSAPAVVVGKRRGRKPKAQSENSVSKGEEVAQSAPQHHHMLRPRDVVKSSSAAVQEAGVKRKASVEYFPPRKSYRIIGSNKVTLQGMQGANPEMPNEMPRRKSAVEIQRELQEEMRVNQDNGNETEENPAPSESDSEQNFPGLPPAPKDSAPSAPRQQNITASSSSNPTMSFPDDHDCFNGEATTHEQAMRSVLMILKGDTPVIAAQKAFANTLEAAVERNTRATRNRAGRFAKPAESDETATAEVVRELTQIVAKSAEGRSGIVKKNLALNAPDAPVSPVQRKGPIAAYIPPDGNLLRSGYLMRAGPIATIFEPKEEIRPSSSPISSSAETATPKSSECERIAELEKEIAELQGKNLDLEKERDDVYKRNTEANDLCNLLLDQKAELACKFAEKEKELGMEKTQKELVEAKKEIRRLTELLELKANEAKKAKETENRIVGGLEAELREAREKLGLFDEKEHELEEVKEKLERMNEKYLKDRDAMKRRISNLEEELREALESDENEEIDELKAQIQQIEKDHAAEVKKLHGEYMEIMKALKERSGTCQQCRQRQQ